MKRAATRGRKISVSGLNGIEVSTDTPAQSDGYSVPYLNRRIIAWDSEGMNLSGDDKPQHCVLFGCSAEVDSPCIGKDLHTGTILNYLCDISDKYPKAIHVGYSFKYDYNMIIKHLTPRQKFLLKTDGKVSIDKGWATCRESWKYRYYIEYIAGKILSIKRYNLQDRTWSRIRIDDVFSFFAKPFLVAAESILSDELSEEDRTVIAHGKADRGSNQWENLDEVKRYWQSEIVIMERMMNRFRNVMYKAGFRLTQWYGPGAIASYLIRSKKLTNHLQNTPEILEVHNASKRAYAGGRFEHFLFGRIQGPVYGIDINSAYPYALSKAPSLGPEHGDWRYQSRPDHISEFGVYHIRYRHNVRTSVFQYAAMPLFYRDSRGGISYPQVVEGWYWSPEAAVAKMIGKRYGGVEILEGWEWEHDGTKPFIFLHEMFNRRMELGKKNVISMPYKLGPNSMYGKLAQRVGHKNGKPPRSHCLPLAGWVTSYCRAMIYRAMLQIPTQHLVAVETDGIYTTYDPHKLNIDTGDGLGQWGIDEYDEMLYLQNGIYHKRRNGEWETPKVRGIDSSSIPVERIQEYLRNAGPGEFAELEVNTKPRFIGIAAALAYDPETVNDRHCVWQVSERDIRPGRAGKRIHSPKACPTCSQNKSAYDAPHPLLIHSRAGIKEDIMSKPHILPWENKSTYPITEQSRIVDEIEEDLLTLGIDFD